MYNLIARGIEEEYLPFCQRFGVAVVPYNPLAGGLLTGKHSRQSGPAPAHASTAIKCIRIVTGLMTISLAVEEMRSIAAEAGKTLVELALQWLLTQPAVDSIILARRGWSNSRKT